MRIAIITIAGISSRFNQGIADSDKALKCIYSEEGKEETLLYHLMKKCAFADWIILVGGYKYDELCTFYENELTQEFPKVRLVKNNCFTELGSGYSLYLGIKAALEYSPDDILFVEGDLDIDEESFYRVIDSRKSVLTYTYEPIYASKSVVLYKNCADQYIYNYNSSHGLLKIDEAFSCILNSGQTWKFIDINALNKAIDDFLMNEKVGTNLYIIQKYIDYTDAESIELIPFKRWINCNTREDYKTIRNTWKVNNI